MQPKTSAQFLDSLFFSDSGEIEVYREPVQF